MGNIVINNRRYRCPERWTELSWEQFRTVLACGEAADHRLAGLSVRLLSLLFGLTEKQAARTVPEERQLFARLYAKEIRRQAERADRFAPDDISGPHVSRHRPGIGFGKRTRGGKAERGAQKQTEGKNLPAIFRRDEKSGAFRWKGKTLRYPRTGTGFGGEAVYFENVSAAELCEATDLYLAGKWEYAPLIVAVLCRRSGEKFDETAAVKRARQMKKLPMRVVRRLYELLMLAHAQLRIVYPACYERTPSSWTGGGCSGPSPRWSELLKWMARYAPSEIGTAGRMNCRDFLGIAQSRIEAKE